MISFLFIFVFSFSASVLFGQRIVDNAGLLSAPERASLTQLIDAVSVAYNFDLVIVTEESIGNSPMEYADDFFDYNGYGLGPNRDGCLFLQVTDERDFWFSTSGRGIKLMNNTAGDKLENDVVRYLALNNPYEAYRAFILDWEQFLELDAKGRSYNVFYKWNAVFVTAAWLISLAAGFIVVMIWKKGMNTALAKTHAAAYVIPGSLSFKVKKDNFLFSNVTKTAKPKDNGSGGGSHRSSSGSSHGGRGGKY